MPKCLLGLALVVGCVSSVAAQSGDSLAIELTVGPSIISGGRRHYIEGGGAAGEVTLSFPSRQAKTPRMVYALNVGGRVSLGNGDVCAIETPPATGCRPHYPDMSHIGILGGWERDLDIIGVRALLGPAFYGGNGASGLGGEAEVDATAGFSHLAFVAVVRGSGIVRFTGESFRVASLQFGLRLR